MSAPQVIVIGGGLSGLSAAHTVLERGGNTLLLEKMPFCGGNSTKATSGINGTLTRTQVEKGINDSPLAFERDTAISAAGGDPNAKASELCKVLTWQSGPAVEWLMDSFGLDLSKVSRLGGASFPRTHRGAERFPGMTITYALMEKYEKICSETPDRAQLLTKANVTNLIKENNAVVGVEYEHNGEKKKAYGPVIIATGGFGADFSDSGILKQVRPDLLKYPTTNGEHCTGDGIKMALDAGAGTVDLAHVQVHPTGLVHPDEPEAKTKFLAAEALRGCGGLLLTADGRRFANELGRRDYVTGEMLKNKGPFRLVLNSKASKEIEWHCKHYAGRGLMKYMPTGEALAKEMGVPLSVLDEEFKKYNAYAAKGSDPFGKKFYHNTPVEVNDSFHVAIVTPVVHYCMGGLHITPEAEVVGPNGKIQGLFAAGEVVGGIHGINRLGGSSLLDCVVFGRVSGATCASYYTQELLKGKAGPVGRLSAVSSHLGPNAVGATVQQNGLITNVSVDPSTNQLNISVNWADKKKGKKSSKKAAASTTSTSTPAPAASTPAPTPAPAASSGEKEYTAEEVAKHNTDNDCWVIIDGQVLDVTDFLKDHPGGKKAIMLYAGKDATEEFDMIHPPNVIPKYAPNSIIGKLKK